jgi:hypothetical protein
MDFFQKILDFFLGLFGVGNEVPSTQNAPRKRERTVEQRNINKDFEVVK